MKRIIAILLCVVCSVSYVSAQGLVITNIKALSGGAVTVTGSSGNHTRQLVLLSVLPDGKTPGDGADVAGDAVYTGQDGTYQAQLQFPSEWKGGRYLVYASSEEGTQSKEFLYVNDSETQQIARSLNNAASAAAFQTILDQSHLLLGMETEAYTAYGKEIGTILYSLKPFTPDAFYTEFNRAAAAAKIKAGQEVTSVIAEYGSFLNYSKDGIEIDCSSVYYEVTDKAVLQELLTNESFLKETFPVIFRKIALTANSKVAKNYSAIQQMMTVGNGQLNPFCAAYLDSSYYDRITLKTNVFQEIFVSRKSINSFAEIKQIFEAAAEAQYQSENSPKSGGGGGGGSGSSPVVQDSVVATPVEQKSSQIDFTDIDKHWAKPQIMALAEKGIISGFEDGSFRPENEVTRAEFIKLVVSAFGLNANGQAEFTDVAETDWFAPYVNGAAKFGLVKGDDQNLFHPQERINRQDAAVILDRVLKRYTELSTGELSFADSGEISGYALEAVQSMTSAGIINGVGNSRFAPLEFATRAQAAALISNSLDYVW